MSFETLLVLHQLGIIPTLILTSEEVQGLSTEDARELRDDFGMGDAMLTQLRELAAEPGRRFRLHFDTQTVEAITD